MAVHRRISTTSSAFLHHIAPPLLRLAFTRSYRISSSSSTAQPQLDFYYYDDDDDIETIPPSPTPSTVLDTEGSRPFRGVHWVFIGNPNAKKHVYAAMISKLLQVPHITISTLLRQDLNPHSPLYKQIADAINCGKLVPESIIFGLLSKRLEDGHHRGENGFILDGIPRTRFQAEILDQLVDVDLVVNFKCSEDQFHTAGSADSTTYCNNAKTRFSNLNNSTEDSQPKVSEFYKKQVQFLEDYYQDQKKLIDFQVGNAPGETWKGLLAALHLQHVNAVHSSRTVTMGFRVP